MQPIKAAELPREAQAFLIAISLGESEDDAKDYRELCGGGYFGSYDEFPDWPGVGSPVSHAAGRYQFEPATWQDVLDANPAITDFSPAAQDRGAWWLAQRDYFARAKRSLIDDLRAGFLTALTPALRRTWTSLNDQLPTRYRAALQFLSAPLVGNGAGAVDGPRPSPDAGASGPPATGAGAGSISSGQAMMLGGVSASMLATTIQWLCHWPIMAPNDVQSTALASLILAGIGAIWHRYPAS